MRPLEARSFTDSIYVVPDTIGGTALAQTVQIFDYPTGARVMRLSVASSISGFSAVINPVSTNVAFPTSALSGATGATLSSGYNICFNNDKLLMIPAGSTGYSLLSPSSGYVSIEFWKF